MKRMQALLIPPLNRLLEARGRRRSCGEVSRNIYINQGTLPPRDSVWWCAMHCGNNLLRLLAMLDGNPGCHAWSRFCCWRISGLELPAPGENIWSLSAWLSAWRWCVGFPAGIPASISRRPMITMDKGCMISTKLERSAVVVDVDVVGMFWA